MSYRLLFSVERIALKEAGMNNVCLVKSVLYFCDTSPYYSHSNEIDMV